jgi:hypothetical protein
MRSNSQRLRQLQTHLLGLAVEGGGGLRIDVRTHAQVTDLVIRATQGDAAAAQIARPLAKLIEEFDAHRASTPCFVCGGPVEALAGLVSVGARNRDPEHVLGAAVCVRCIMLPVEQLRAQVLEVLGTVGIEPGAGSGRNLHPDGGRV